MSKLEIQNISVDYTEKNKSFTALKNVSFDVEEGEFVSVIGSSGCGKSTLLSILEGINTPTEGAVLIDGKPIHGTGPDRGVVFQNYSLFPWMTARKNVAFGVKQIRKDLRLLGVSKELLFLDNSDMVCKEIAERFSER